MVPRCWSLLGLALAWLLPVASAEYNSGVASSDAAGGFALWEGDIVGMSSRRVFAMSTDRAVMCYSRHDGAGCRVAIGAVQSSSHGGAGGGKQRQSPQGQGPRQGEGPGGDVLAFVDSSGGSAHHPTGSPSAADAVGVPQMRRHPHLELPWGEVQLLDGARPVDRLEALRLSSDRFAVCYQKEGNTVSCTLGHVEAPADVESGPSLKLFTEPLQLGPGHLVAMMILEEGRRFIVCHGSQGGPSLPSMGILAARGRPGAECSWAEVHVDEGEEVGSDPSLRWTDDVALKFFNEEEAPVANG